MAGTTRLSRRSEKARLSPGWTPPALVHTTPANISRKRTNTCLNVITAKSMLVLLLWITTCTKAESFLEIRVRRLISSFPTPRGSSLRRPAGRFAQSAGGAAAGFQTACPPAGSSPATEAKRARPCLWRWGPPKPASRPGHGKRCRTRRGSVLFPSNSHQDSFSFQPSRLHIHWCFVQ